MLTAVAIESLSVDAGGSVTVPVNIDDSTDVRSFDLVIQYDTSLLDTDSAMVSLGGLASGFNNFLANVDDANGTVFITASTPTPLSGMAGTLVNIVFTAAPSTTATAAVAFVPPPESSINAGDIATTFTGGIVTINNPANDAPTFDLAGAPTVTEDAGAQSINAFIQNASPGPPDESGQQLSITVSNDNNALFATQPDIDLASGELTFQPAPNANGAAEVSVTIMDDGSTADGGTDSTTKTFTIVVDAVNDAPTFDLGGNQTANEDSGLQTVTEFLSNVSPGGGSDEAGQSFESTISATNSALFIVQPEIDLGTRTLTYTPAPNAFGTSTVTVTLADGGGTDNGGMDFTTKQFTITIESVNDPPSVEVAQSTISIDEDSTVTPIGDFVSLSAGPSNESGQNVTPVLSGFDPSLFAVAPDIDSSGTLTFTLAPNANGNTTVTITATDNGGTERGGIDAATAEFMINVTSINDPPVVTLQNTVDALLEDTSTSSSIRVADIVVTDDEEGTNSLSLSGTHSAFFSIVDNAGMKELHLRDGVSLDHESVSQFDVTVEVIDNTIPETAPSTADFSLPISDVDEVPVVTFPATSPADIPVPENRTAAVTIVANDPEGALVTYSISPDDVAENADRTAFRIDGASGALSFVTAPDFDNPTDANVDRVYEVIVEATDGTATPVQQLLRIEVVQFGYTGNGMAAPNENQTVAIRIPYQPADATGLTLGLEGDDSGLFNIAFDPDTADQALVTFKNAPDFEAPDDGDQNRTYNFTATLTGMSPTVGSVSSSIPVTLTLQNVDEAPVFTIPMPSHTSLEDQGPVSVPGFATGISAIEPDQTASLDFVFTPTGTTGGLSFTTAPDIDPTTGALTYQASGDSNGTATFDVFLTDSGATNNRSEIPDISITITVNAVNDAPTIDPVDDPAPVDEDNQVGPITVTVGDIDSPLTSVTLTATSSDQMVVPNSGIEITGTGATRMVTIHPAPNASGVAVITLVANDGALDSEGEPFTVTFNAVNDPPVVSTNIGLTIREGETRVVQMNNLDATDVESTPAQLTYTIANEGDGPSAGTLLLDGAPATYSPSFTFTQQDIDDGRLTYRHDDLEVTSDSFTYTVDDGGNTGSGGTMTAGPDTFDIRVLTILAPIQDQTFGTGLGQVRIPVAAAVIDGDVPTLSAGELPSFVTFTPTANATGIFTFDPQPGDEGSSPYVITLNATTMDGTDSVSFNANVVVGPTEVSNETVQFVNVGGPGISSAGITGDQGGGSTAFRNTGTSYSSGATIDISDESVPAGTPASIFQTQRWDGAGGPEMQFSFPVEPGDYRVNLYFAELYQPTSRVGARVFDVAIEGNVEFDNLDVFSEVGANAGLVKTVDVTADSTLNIAFLHQVENPIISAIEIINLNEVPSQLAPVLSSIGHRQAAEGQTLTIDFRAPDAQGDDVSFSFEGVPSEFVQQIDNGNGTGRLIVTPTEGQAGEYPITITSTQENGVSLTDAESFVLSVQPTNDPPQIDINDPLILDEGTTATIGSDLLSSSDPDDDDAGLTYRLTAGPTHGELLLNDVALSVGGTFTQGQVDGMQLEYEHFGGEQAADSFAFTLMDGGEDGVLPVAGTFDISISPVNDAPSIDVASDLTVRAGGTRRISVAQLSGSDPDNTPSELIFTVLGGPGEGRILVNGSPSTTFMQQDLLDGVVEYENTNGQATLDRFTVQLSDPSSAMSEPETIDVTISDSTILAPVPDQTIGAGTGPVDIRVAAARVDGVMPSLSATIPMEFQPFASFTDNGNGTGRFTFDPAVSDLVSSSVTWTASAGNVMESDTFDVAIVSVPTDASNETVHFVNVGGPGISSAGITGDQGGGSTAFRNTGTSYSSGATIDISDESIPAGTPASIFQTQRWDGAGGPEMQFSFPVEPGDYRVNLYFAELYQPTSRVGARVFDVAIEGNVEFDNLDVFSEVGANAGLVKTVDVTADSTLNIAFLHQVENPIISAIQIINLNEVPSHSGPVLTPIGNMTVNEGQIHRFTVSATDAQDDDLVASVTGQPPFVTVSEPDANGAVTVTIQPNEGDAGQYPINVTVTQQNGLALTDSESLVLTVIGVNEPPVLTVNNPLTVMEGATGEIDDSLLNSMDPDDAPGELSYSFTMISGPSHGQLLVDGTALPQGGSFTQADINAGLLSYQNDGGEAATDSFNFTLTDGGEDGAAPTQGTFNINIEPVNDAPMLDVSSGVSVNEGATRVITTSVLSSSDVDNVPGELTYTVTSGPTAGTLRLNGTPTSAFTQQDINNRLVTYSQDGTVAATDSFDFSLSDGLAAPVAGSFEISITGEPPFELKVNAGGPAVDGFVPANGLQNGAGTRYGTGATIDVSDPSVAGIPASVFQTVLYDPAGGADLSFDVPLEEGATYEVTLLFSEVYGPAFRAGARVFDVSIDGVMKLDNFDIFSAAGAGNTAIARSFQVTSDGNLDIDFGRVVENPAIAGISIREIDDAFSAPDSLPEM